MENFKDKVVVITGGATGIGFAFAKAFGKEGAKVVIASRRKERVDDSVNKLKDLGIEAIGTTCDVSKREDVEKLADFSWNEFGKVDVLINNAGTVTQNVPVIGSTVEDFLKIYNVNIFGVVNGCSVFGKRFVEQKTPAAIYNVGSENSLFNGVPLSTPYVSSKHAVLAITESLKEEVPEFIEVGLICPGYVRSELSGGDEELMKTGMDTDKYVSIAMEQIKNREFFIVSHSYNMKRINDRYEKVKASYEMYAPRYEGDEEFDVKTLFSRMQGGNQ